MPNVTEGLKAHLRSALRGNIQVGEEFHWRLQLRQVRQSSLQDDQEQAQQTVRCLERYQEEEGEAKP